MEVYKFGGTSVGTSGRIVKVADIISNNTKKIVVLSANGKSTDLLADIIHQLNEGKIEEAEKCFLNILEHDPQNKEAFNNLGVIAFQGQEIEGIA